LKKIALAAALLAASLISSAPVNAAGFEDIAPHRAVYDIELKKASERSGIKSMNGRIVYEVRGNACDGISLQYRFLTNVTTGRDQFLSDQHTSTFESADGRSFNFLTKSFLNEQLEKTLKGRAKQTDKGISVVLDSPAAQEFEFPNARFITSYLVKIIELAKRGEHFLRDDLYDGSDDGDETVATSSFISNPKTILDGKDGRDSRIATKLKGIKAWSVSMSYFNKNTGASAEHLPIFESSFLLFENGISSDLVMRYPDYTLTGKMTELEIFEDEPCTTGG
jgi:hypothetical protein